MFCFYLTLVTMATSVLGCSPPIGGFKPPTPPEKASFAQHLVIGEVRKILPVDPLFLNNFDSTYGASVYVQCTYKGNPLPGLITIGGAGFIPGHCTSKDLKQDKKYLMFLTETRGANNETLYEQVEPAEPSGNISNYLDVCGLKMTYPEEGGMMLKRRICEETSDGPCRSYNQQTGKTETKQIRSSTPPTKRKDTKEVASVKIGNNLQQQTTEDPGNGSCGLGVSFGLVLMSFLSFVF